MKLQLLYFASLADAARRNEELLETTASTPRRLYAEVAARHGFNIDASRLRVAVNGRFGDWDATLADGDEVVFIPPVSGG